MLLDTTSIQYLRRLVRELNAAQDGFYASVGGFSVRCNRARTKNNQIQAKSPSCCPQWFVPSTMIFTDPYGREIVASRKK